MARHFYFSGIRQQQDLLFSPYQRKTFIFSCILLAARAFYFVHPPSVTNNYFDAFVKANTMCETFLSYASANWVKYLFWRIRQRQHHLFFNIHQMRDHLFFMHPVGLRLFMFCIRRTQALLLSASSKHRTFLFTWLCQARDTLFSCIHQMRDILFSCISQVRNLLIF